MIYRKVPAGVVAVILVIVALLAGWLGFLNPERLAFYAFTAAFLPCAWGVLTLAGSGRSDAAGPDAYSGALALGGLLIGVSLGTRLATTLGAIDETTAERAVGVALGGLLIVTGNALPKILTPLERLRCDPVRVQSLQRFAGWSFVITGMLYAVLWLILTPEHAAAWSSRVTAACVLLVAARFLLLAARRPQSPPVGRQPAPGPPSP